MYIDTVANLPKLTTIKLYSQPLTPFEHSPLKDIPTAFSAHTGSEPMYSHAASVYSLN